MEEYDAGEPSIYTVVFREKNFSIHAKYDAFGNIISTIEKHANIKVPPILGHKIAFQYPGWHFKNTVFIIKYSKKRKTYKTLKVLIQKGVQKKVLKLVV